MRNRRRRRKNMSDDVNKKVEEVKVEESKVEESKVEESKVEESKVEEKESKKTDNNDDIFITESDRFTVEIRYYLNEKKEPIVEDFDEEYVSDGKDIRSFEIYFKYPSQKDTEYIMGTKPIQTIEDAQYIDFIELENVRIVTLLRGWSMDERPLEDLANIHPKIIKALRAKVSAEIGSSGLF